MRRWLPAGRRVLVDPAAGAVQDGRRRRAQRRCQPDPAGQRAPDARPDDPHRRVRHPASHGRADGSADRAPRHRGQPLDVHHQPVLRWASARGGRSAHHPRPGQPGTGHPAALQVPARRGGPGAVRAGDRGFRHAARCHDGAAKAADGPPDRRRADQQCGRARHRRPAARPAARRDAQRHPGPAGAADPRLPAGRPEPGTIDDIVAALDELDEVALLDLSAVARVLGINTFGDALDAAVSPRGYRLLAGIPRVPRPCWTG